MDVTIQSSMEEPATEPSFEACYDAHHAKIFHLGLRYGGGNSAWAEDLTHDVFLTFVEKKHELHTLDDVGAWLYRVASNLAISRLRREGSFWRRLTLARFAEVEATGASAASLLEDQESASNAMAALRKLPPKEQIVLSMKILDEKSQKDIAASLSMSEGYVSKLIRRGLERLSSQGWEASL